VLTQGGDIEREVIQGREEFSVHFDDPSALIKVVAA